MTLQQGFINRLREPALRVEKDTGMPAAITIAQAALETGWGRFVPRDKYTGVYSYNLFGIKWHRSPVHDYIVTDTYEHINGQRVLVPDEKFRRYSDYQESIDDRTRFLLDNRRYDGLWGISDPTEFARELQRAGYATDPGYANKLIRIMRENGLLELSVGELEPETDEPVIKEGGPVKSAFTALLWGFVQSMFMKIVWDSVENLWSVMWKEIFAFVPEAEKRWDEGQAKKQWVMERVMKLIEERADLGWIQRQFVRLFLSQIVDAVVEAINEELGKDWIKRVEELERDLAGRIPFVS